MPTSTLPEITLQCSAGHTVRTRARGGQAVKCPECKVSVWVPAGRPVDASAAASSGTSPMAARWAEESAPEDSELYPPSGIPCPNCGSDQVWEPGRTLLLCLACEGPNLPPSIGEHYRRAELAVRRTTDVDRAEQLRTEVRKRMEFSQGRDKAIRAVRSWLPAVDPDTLPASSGLIGLAAELHSNLKHILREFEGAKNGAELAAALDVAKELIGVVKSYRDQLDNERSRVVEEDDDEEDDEYEDAEYEEDDEEDDEEPEYRPEWLNGYGQRQSRYATPGGQVIRSPRQPAALVPFQRNQVVPQIVPPSFTAQMAVALANRKPKQWCAFDHLRKAPAAYEYYGSQWAGGNRIDGAPSVLCCEKHRDHATKWIESHGYSNQTYLTLETQ